MKNKNKQESKLVNGRRFIRFRVTAEKKHLHKHKQRELCHVTTTTTTIATTTRTIKSWTEMAFIIHECTDYGLRSGRSEYKLIGFNW